MREQKIIKDLKERNIKLKNQYELECIRHSCTSLKLEKYKNLVDKIFNKITLLKIEDITMETNKILNDLLDILKEVEKHEQ